MNFLQLVQKACEESGVVPGMDRPASLSTSDEMERRFIGWVREAWDDIQTDQIGWLWMQQDFDVPLLEAIGRYSATALNLSRVSAWVPYDGYGRAQFTVYTDPARADESHLLHMEYGLFRQNYLVGAERTGRPVAFSVSPKNELVFGPLPDAATYRVRGVYNASPQTLTAAADVPEMPAAYHMLIVYRALLKADVFDEGPGRLPYWLSEKERLGGALRGNQLPRAVLGGALA